MGSLRYLTHSRPDLMFCTRYLNKYMENLSMEHFGSAKFVLRYVKGEECNLYRSIVSKGPG